MLARTLLFLGAMAAVGCGSADSSVGDFAGTVTLDGNSIEVGTVTFVPTDGQSPTSGGAISGGRYSARVPIGEMKVAFSAPRPVGKKKLYPRPDSPEMDVTEERLPPRYNAKTELKLVIQPGQNDGSFALTSK